MSARKGKTAAEVLAELGRDPEYQARIAAKERQRAIATVRWREAEVPLVAALVGVGVTVESVWDLVNTGRPYPAAIPVLLEHLQREYPERVREGIARALAVPGARSGWNTLLSLFRAQQETTTTGVKWAIGLALAASADEDVIEDLLALLLDASHGENRAAFVERVARSRHPRARAVLQALATDPQLSEDIKRTTKPRRATKPR